MLAADREQRELLALTGKPLSVSPSAVGYRPREEVETCLPEPQGKGQGISMSFRGMGKSLPMDIRLKDRKRLYSRSLTSVGMSFRLDILWRLLPSRADLRFAN